MYRKNEDNKEYTDYISKYRSDVVASGLDKALTLAYLKVFKAIDGTNFKSSIEKCIAEKQKESGDLNKSLNEGIDYLGELEDKADINKVDLSKIDLNEMYPLFVSHLAFEGKLVDRFRSLIDISKDEDDKNNTVAYLILENVTGFGEIERYFHTLIKPEKYGPVNSWKLVNYYWHCWFSIIEGLEQYLQAPEACAKGEKPEIKLDYRDYLYNLEARINSINERMDAQVNFEYTSYYNFSAIKNDDPLGTERSETGNRSLPDR